MNDSTQQTVSKRRKGDDGIILNDTTMNHNESSVTTMAGPTSYELQKYDDSQQQQQVEGPPSSTTTRSSSLPSPTLQLTGHTGSVYALEYSPSGSTLCSTSFDMTCLLWQHRPLEFDDDNDDEYDYDNNIHYRSTINQSHTQQQQQQSNNIATYHNFHTLHGHKNAVLDCTWLDNYSIVTASADHTLLLWDIYTQQRLRKYTTHTSIVNAVTTINYNLFISVSDDTNSILWDRRTKHPITTIATDYPILAVAAGSGLSSSNTNINTTSNEYQIYTSGIDPIIRIWDIRQINSNGKLQQQSSSSSSSSTLEPLYGHTDTVTCLSIHPDGTHLLSNSMDQTLIQWDIRPFVTSQQQSILPTYPIHQQQLKQPHPRHVKTFVGHQHSAEKGLLKCSWSADGTFVSAGSSDTNVHIWDVYTGQEIYNLPGHKGCVNTVTFHPTETTIIASGSSDKNIFVGELS
jgi:Prp8 binding protein